MFDLTTVWLLMIVGAIIAAFWQLRKVAELARKAGEAYCQKHRLQLLSIAMSNLKFRFTNGVQILVEFDLNYSPEGITSKKGEIVIANGRVEQISHWG